MVEPEKTCCFTGHRPSKLPWREDERDPRCIALKREISQRIEELYLRGCRHFICGMAKGCDLYFCEAVLALRDGKYPDIRVESAIPCRSQADRWQSSQRERREGLLKRCNWETLIQHEYDPGCMMRRNRYMVDNADIVLAVFNGKRGGTMHTLSYAMRNEKEVLIINLSDYE